MSVSLRIGPPKAEEVQIEMKATTLCGPDVHYYTHFRNGDIQIKEPLSQGHESAGLVVAVGPEVASNHGIKVGDRVAVEAGVPCDKCEVCLDGDYNVAKICDSVAVQPPSRTFRALFWSGSIIQPSGLPETLSYVDGALLEPLAVAIHSVRKADAKPGATCLVVGAGAVGLLCAAAAKCAGYSRVVMADIASNRLAFAKGNNFANETVTLVSKRANSIEDGLASAKKDAADLVARNQGDRFARTFECTGVEGCVRTAIYATRGGGKVLLVGMGTPIQTLPMSAVSLREVDLVGVWRYANCYPQGIKLMERSTKDRSIPDLKGLITHSYKGLSMVPEAFDK
ncbi:hypothetical protein N8I77_013448 [Diaporthe amygdali]|uniref:L-arabinitol 4-dehydrogenase n=1 Tax=Phomopsis amygdali TaxID=1214568 RepID=A0AAD9S2H3_PHOAM|nr:hypothetical protein N8I77_013448 [Diaporthe amygdali]